MSDKNKVFIVDDSVVTRMFISSIVNEIPNIEISQFVNGQEVIDAIANAHPDLLILDSVMPVMDGLSVLSQLKEMDIDFPIIFCTADIQSTTKEKAEELGVSEFINKPIDKVLLKGKIEKLLSK